MKILNVIERIMIVACAFLIGFAYHPSAGLATLIALDTLLDIRHAVEGNEQ